MPQRPKPDSTCSNTSRASKTPEDDTLPSDSCHPLTSKGGSRKQPESQTVNRPRKRGIFRSQNPGILRVVSSRCTRQQTSSEHTSITYPRRPLDFNLGSALNDYLTRKKQKPLGAAHRRLTPSQTAYVSPQSRRTAIAIGSSFVHSVFCLLRSQDGFATGRPD